MKYDEVKKNVFATCNIPDGYFGDRATVGVAMIKSRVVFVGDCGYFQAPILNAIDQEEALWLLNNHPSAKNIKRIVTV